jgi:hypothetical protein
MHLQNKIYRQQVSHVYYSPPMTLHGDIFQNTIYKYEGESVNRSQMEGKQLQET